MQHTIAAVFNSQSQAQKACEALISSGIPRNEVHVTQSDEPEDKQARLDQDRQRESSGSGIRSFFAEIFGADSDRDADLYSEAVEHGNYVLTVTVPNDDQVEEAAEVLDQYDPLDIDEQASNWKSGAWAASDSMRQSASTADTTQQQSRPTITTSGIGAAQLRQDQSSGSSRAASSSLQQAAGSETQSIPVIQEELKVGKRAVQRGGVRVYQRVVEKPVQKTLDLREEEVSVERRPVNQPADLSALKEGSIEVRETSEEPVIQKTARVVEEVVVGKKVKQRQQQINDTVRSTEVEVEQLSGSSNLSDSSARYSQEDNDAYFRNHWNSNYASAGGNYEDYAPAYQYGSTLSSNDQYRGRQWNDVETSVRSDWEARNPGSTWEKVKGAVRHGWERMTS